MHGKHSLIEYNVLSMRFVMCSMQSSAQSLFWSLFGLLDVGDLSNCTHEEATAGKIVFGLWLLQAMIILLNMLIALVTNKFDEFQVR